MSKTKAKKRVDISDLSEEEIQDILEAKRKKKKQEQERARKTYEDNRDQSVEKIMENVDLLSNNIQQVRIFTDKKMDLMFEAMQDYGDIRSNSQGGFTVTHSNGQMRIKRKRYTQPQWDERADKAESLLREFLDDTIKKKDKDLAEIIMSFLAKNKQGELRYSSVMKLMQHRERYNDQRWLTALKLLEESYNQEFTKYTYIFQIRNDDGEWVNVEPLTL